MAATPAPVLVLGIGNVLLMDEAVGVRAVEAYQADYAVPDGVEVMDGGTAGMDLMEPIAGRRHLVVVDAVKKADAQPGDIVRLGPGEVPAFFRERISPHQTGLADVLAALNLSNEAPETVRLVGMVPEALGTGVALSDTCERALPGLVEMVVGEVSALP